MKQLHANELPATCKCGRSYAPGTLGFSVHDDLADFKCEDCIKKELQREQDQHEEECHPD